MQKYVTHTYRIYFLLGIIVLFGFFIRIYQNTTHPSGFFCDEAGLTYEAYTIAHTGKDSFGHIFPFYFTIFSPRGPVAIYDQVPFIWIFGLNEFTSRFTSATIGTITIILLFFIMQLLFKNRIASIFAAFLLTISPWHIQFSRFGTENIRVPFYFGFFLLFFLIGIHKQKKVLVSLSIFFLFLVFYAYTAADIFIFPFIAGIALIYRNYFFKNRLFSLFLCVLIFICCFPFFYQMLFFSRESRFAQVSILNNHSFLEATTQMTKTYIQSYSPDFLFLKGDADMPNHFINRFSVKSFGELYFATVPFFIFGFFFLVKKSKKKEHQLLLLWLLLYPLGSVVAGADGGGPFATRSIIGVMIFQIITALGIYIFLSWIKHKHLKKLSLVLLIMVFCLSNGKYLYTYFFLYPQYSEDFWGWQYGAKDIVQYFVQHQETYDKEIMAPEFNSPEIFFRFYAPNDCTKCKVGLPQESFDSRQRQLFAITPLYLQKHREFIMTTQKQIIYPNGTVAFLIGEIKKRDDNKTFQ